MQEGSLKVLSFQAVLMEVQSGFFFRPGQSPHCPFSLQQWRKFHLWGSPSKIWWSHQTMQMWGLSQDLWVSLSLSSRLEKTQEWEAICLSQRHRLLVHQIIHTREKPFTCTMSTSPSPTEIACGLMRLSTRSYCRSSTDVITWGLTRKSESKVSFSYHKLPQLLFGGNV
jgi:hypothetical protein